MILNENVQIETNAELDCSSQYCHFCQQNRPSSSVNSWVWHSKYMSLDRLFERDYVLTVDMCHVAILKIHLFWFILTLYAFWQRTSPSSNFQKWHVITCICSIECYLQNENPRYDFNTNFHRFCQHCMNFRFETTKAPDQCLPRNPDNFFSQSISMYIMCIECDSNWWRHHLGQSKTVHICIQLAVNAMHVTFHHDYTFP